MSYIYIYIYIYDISTLRVNAEVKHEGSYTSAPPIRFHGVYGEKHEKRCSEKYIDMKCTTIQTGGPDSSVGIATRYKLDGPGIECRWEP
jgi:hypothetical protein